MTDPARHPASSLLNHRLFHLLILLGLASLLLFPGLGDLGLTDRDEGSNAEAAREMLETGDWLSPTLNYEPRFAKPAFVYWLIGASYSLFGISEFSARLPSAIFGLALMILQYLFLIRVCQPSIALFGTLMLLLNIEMVAIHRLVLTDSELIFFTTLSAYGFWLGLHGSGHNRQFFWLFYLGMALAMLAKGPVGFVIPLLAVVPYLTLTRQWRTFWLVGYPLAGSCLFLLIAAPWYLAMLAIHGAEYAASAQANTVGRFISSMESHSGTVLFFLPILLFGFFPWSGLLPFTLYQTFRNWRAAKTRRLEKPAKLEKGNDLPTIDWFDLRFFAAVWVVGIFLFFSLSATRLPHYIGPLFPAASILTAVCWSRWLDDPTPPGLLISLRTLTVLGYILGLGFTFVPAIYDLFRERIAKEFPAAVQVDPGWTPVIIGFIIVSGVIFTRHLLLTEHRRSLAFGSTCAMMVLMILITIHSGLPRFNRFFVAPMQELAMIAGYNLGPSDVLIQYGRKRPSLTFYAKRKIIQISPSREEKFKRYAEISGRVMVLLQSHLRSRLPEPVSEYPVILERFGYALLSNQAMVR